MLPKKFHDFRWLPFLGAWCNLASVNSMSASWGIFSSFKVTLLPKTSWLQIVLIQIWGQGNHLVGGWTNPKKMLVKMGASSPNRDEHKKYLKPHNLVIDLRPLFLIYWNSIAFAPWSYGARRPTATAGPLRTWPRTLLMAHESVMRRDLGPACKNKYPTLRG